MAFMMRRPVRSLKYKNINFLWAAPVRPICIFKSAFSQHFHTGANRGPKIARIAGIYARLPAFCLVPKEGPQSRLSPFLRQRVPRVSLAGLQGAPRADRQYYAGTIALLEGPIAGINSVVLGHTRHSRLDGHGERLLVAA